MKNWRMFFPTAVGLTLVVIAAASPAWSQPPQVTLCHKGKTTLTLPVPAAAAHIAQHGDTLGPCGCGPCIADDDCPAGTGCNAADVCVPWCACPECDVCAGFCVE